MKQKIKIMKQRPELSDEEIRGYMDFDKLIASRKQMTTMRGKFTWMKRVIPIVAISAIAVWFLLDGKTNPSVQNVPDTQLPVQNISPTDGEPVKTEEVKTPETSMDEDSGVQRDLPQAIAKNPKMESTQPLPVPETKVPESTYVQAEPKEGYDALYRYFNSQLVYPVESIRDSVQGVQTISFVINAEGKPEGIEIRQTLGEPFEREARRLIENMPAWNPALLNGQAVPSRVSLPLTFQLQKVKNR